MPSHLEPYKHRYSHHVVICPGASFNFPVSEYVAHSVPRFGCGVIVGFLLQVCKPDAPHAAARLLMHVLSLATAVARRL